MPDFLAFKNVDMKRPQLPMTKTASPRAQSRRFNALSPSGNVPMTVPWQANLGGCLKLPPEFLSWKW
jgi:hypothetical protein